MTSSECGDEHDRAAGRLLPALPGSTALDWSTRFGVMLTGGTSGRHASLAQGVPPVLSLRPAYQ